MASSRGGTLLLAAFLGGVALAGCSWVNELNEWPPKDTPARVSEAGTPTPPQTRLMQTPDATWLEPVNEPPVEHMVPKDGQSSGALNRINELEEEVASLRNEMSTMMPAMTKLAQTQSALRDAVAERAAAVAPAAGVVSYEPMPLYVPDNARAPQVTNEAVNPDAAYVPPPVQPQAEVLSQAAMTMPAAENAPVPVTPVAMPSPSSAPPIGNIRFADNNGKTRIVLDAAFAPDYSYSIDAAAGMLTVNLPGAGWAPSPAGAAGVPLVASYNAAPDGAGGTILSLKLSAPARVAMAQALPPGGGKGHRLIIDVAPQ